MEGLPSLQPTCTLKNCQMLSKQKYVCTDCQAPEETQLQVKLLKAELQDQVPVTASRHGRGECHTVSLRRWSYTEVSFPPASSAKPRTWAIMSDFQRSMSDCIDSMYAVCRCWETCAFSRGLLRSYLYIGQGLRQVLKTTIRRAGRNEAKNGLHLYCRPASPSWQSRQ